MTKKTRHKKSHTTVPINWHLLDLVDADDVRFKLQPNGEDVRSEGLLKCVRQVIFVTHEFNAELWIRKYFH